VPLPPNVRPRQEAGGLGLVSDGSVTGARH
jgi:hypothetical protein